MDPGADFVAIETPEHVVFHYELAGVMSRVIAGCVDILFQSLILLGILLVGALVVGGAALAGDIGAEMSMTALALLYLAIFVDVWGYSILFELFMRGQTPGKLLLRIRVIREGGYALTAGDVIVRNLMRIADFLPFGYGLGLIVMCVNRRNKRIGDFVAGTLVIRDAPAIPPPSPVRSTELRRRASDPAAVDELRTAGVHRLSGEQVRLIESFLERRHGLDAGARRDLARRLADPVAQTLGVAAPQAELFLQNVLLAYRESEQK